MGFMPVSCRPIILALLLLSVSLPLISANRIPVMCNFPVGILCTSPELEASELTLTLQNGHGNPINICAITCDDTATADTLATITASSCMLGQANYLGTIDVGDEATVAAGSGCTDVSGPVNTLGTRYRGKLFIQYIEVGDTGNARVMRGELQAVVGSHSAEVKRQQNAALIFLGILTVLALIILLLARWRGIRFQQIKESLSMLISIKPSKSNTLFQSILQVLIISAIFTAILFLFYNNQADLLYMEPLLVLVLLLGGGSLLLGALFTITYFVARLLGGKAPYARHLYFLNRIAALSLVMSVLLMLGSSSFWLVCLIGLLSLISLLYLSAVYVKEVHNLGNVRAAIVGLTVLLSILFFHFFMLIWLLGVFYL